MPHFIPHPLCQNDPKVPRDNLENIDQYVKDSPNPRWAASHIVMAIANGLVNADMGAANKLRDIANMLATGGRISVVDVEQQLITEEYEDNI